jgi:two-component system chemotaxis sensor kinase CheA
MDIVKEAVARAKGHITTDSKPGKGTTFSLHFPLSTAIIDGMLTRTGENIFIIPIASIIESFKVKEEQVHQVATGIQVLDLRGRMIPIIRIAEVFNITESGQGNIATIVENVSGEQFAVMNDEILAKREVVIKNLGACFKNLKGISSGSVLSGGAIGFVLDIEQVIELGKESRLQEGGAA